MLANTTRIAGKRTLGRPELGQSLSGSNGIGRAHVEGGQQIVGPGVSVSKERRSVPPFYKLYWYVRRLCMAALKGNSRRGSTSTSKPTKDRQSRAIPPPLIAWVRDLFQKAVQSVLYPPVGCLRCEFLNTTAGISVIPRLPEMHLPFATRAPRHSADTWCFDLRDRQIRTPRGPCRVPCRRAYRILGK